MENECELTYQVKIRNQPQIDTVSDDFVDTHIKLIGINNIEWIQKDNKRSYNGVCGVCGELHERP